MKRNLLCTLIFSATALLGCDANSSDAKTDTLITVQSELSVEETANKLNATLNKKGLTVFARINHSDNAEKADLKLRPTELIIFGNPKVGTPLMQCSQTTAIDLPQKMLIWEDEKSNVWLSYNDPAYLKQRHTIEGCDKVIGKITKVLGAVSKAATSK